MEDCRAQGGEKLERLKWCECPGGDGIITGCDLSTEWMLRWWYSHYAAHNNYKVIFANFGMSNGAVAWCKSHGLVVDLLYDCAKNWFKKPVAILNAPFDRIVWIDTDCEIRGDIGQLFKYAQLGMYATHDPFNKWCKGTNPVNTGVIAIKHGDPLVVRWAQACENAASRGDQEVLDAMLGPGERVRLLPSEMHRLRLQGDGEALIMHWTGPAGKSHIKRQCEK